MASLLENKEFAAMTIILLTLSILCRFITGIFLNSLIREAENMSATQNRFLKQCKAKFRSCYRLNDGVPNIPVFVDRFMGKIQIGRFSIDGLAHLSGQLTLLAVFAAGLGACAAIIEGKTPGEILPYYLLSFLGLYLYFSISGLVDLEGKKALLKVSLTDFLENHMAPRLAVLEESERLARGGGADRGNGRTEDGNGGAGTVRRDDFPGSGEGKTAESIRSGAGRMYPGEEAAAAFAFAGKLPAGKGEGGAEAGPAREAAGKSAAQKRMEEQVFSKTQEKELEELLKEFFA